MTSLDPTGAWFPDHPMWLKSAMFYATLVDQKVEKGLEFFF